MSAPDATRGGMAGVRIGRWLLFALLVAGWHACHVALGQHTIASPWDTLSRLWQLGLGGELWKHLAATARVSFIGLVLGWLAGAGLALALDRSARLASALEPYVLASMGIPKFALAPLLILWFGIGDAPKAVVVTLMVFYVVFVTALSGLRAVDTRLLSMARVAGAGAWASTREVLLPSITPFLLSGLKVAIPRAISATVVGEFLVADSGLGYYIEHSRQTADTTGVYAGLVIVTFLVLCSDGLLGLLQRRLLSWRPPTSGTAAH